MLSAGHAGSKAGMASWKACSTQIVAQYGFGPINLRKLREAS
jgi:hypothetical protein